MFIKYYCDLIDFKFWSGAIYTVTHLTEDEMCILQTYLEDYYRDVQEIPSETDINDFFWFELDLIAQILDYNDWDDLMNNRK